MVYLITYDLGDQDYERDLLDYIDDIVVYVLTLDGWAGYGPSSRNEALKRALG